MEAFPVTSAKALSRQEIVMNVPSILRDPSHPLAPTDPYERGAQTFPELPEEMVARLMRYGHEESVAADVTLYKRGDRRNDFFVVLDGKLEIYDLNEYGQLDIFSVYERHQFTGELDLFNDREVLVSCRSCGDGRVLRVKRADLRAMIVAEPDIGEIVLRACILRREGLIHHAHGAATLVGSMHDGETLRLHSFMGRNSFPHRVLDTDGDSEAAAFLECFDIVQEQLPAVILNDNEVLRRPTLGQLADRLGLTEVVDPAKLHDVAVVGAGPAGLSAALYAASEGLETIVIEGMAPGGQAGTSSKIENYLGFPTGVSGQALAERAQVQAQKFGARLAVSRFAAAVDCEAQPYAIRLDDGQSIRARSIVVATGARYRKLAVDDFERFEGQGIHFAATAMEAQLCASQEVVVVGGGNSAGQAAVFLSRTCAHVHVLIRRDGLASTMSDYLVQRIDLSQRITLYPRTEITSLAGDASLREVGWTNRGTGCVERRKIGSVFIMIGAEPNTEWLSGCLELDSKNFVVTGRDKRGRVLHSPYATSLPGIFAVGDVRAGSIKRVASGVGEGSVVISAIHQHLESS
jgi:thioredoxin reductase (NADPH)